MVPTPLLLVLVVPLVADVLLLLSAAPRLLVLLLSLFVRTSTRLRRIILLCSVQISVSSSSLSYSSN